MAELKKLVRTLDKARNAKEKHEALNDIADHHNRNGNYEEALKFYEEELIVANELQDKAKIAKAHRMIGEVKVALSDHDKALKHTLKYCEYACSSVSKLEERQQAYTTLGRAYLVYADTMPNKNSSEFLDKHKLARKALWKSLELCDKLEEEKHKMIEIADMRARSLLNFGVSYEGTNEFGLAEKEYDLALRTCQKYNLEETLRIICYTYGSLLLRQRKFTDALNIYKEAIATTKTLSGKKHKDVISEILIAEADVHLWMGDIYTARKVLHKAYKKGEKLSDSPEGEKLRTVAAIDFAQRKILLAPDMSPEEKSKKYEIIGDGFSSLQLYEFALSNYEKMLECCKIADNNLDACYRSLALTCQDLKRYDDAISYFEQEILYCTPKESCLSLLRIHDCQVLSKASLSDQLEILNQAERMANDANNAKLQKKVLVRLRKVQKKAGSSAINDTRQKLKTLAEYSSDSEEDEGSQGCTPNIGEHIDLDMLSDYSEDELEEEDGILESKQSRAPRQKRNPNQAKATVKWRNEKGETKLHVACISGKINAVRTLLQQGCDVNATDHAGWTPLHEACNFGHLDIVELLLENGADINFRSSCGGITPLADAASNGNFDVIEFLLDRGASVVILTDKEETPLNTLMAYYGRQHDSFTPEQHQQFLCVRDRLQASLEKVGHLSKHSPEHIDDRRRKRKNGVKGPSPSTSCAGKLRRSVDTEDIISLTSHRKRAMRDISPVSSTGSSPLRSSEGDIVDEEGEGVSEYVSAIKNLRKPSEAPCETELMRKPVEPLLSDSEVVEDWLEDDVGKQPTKKRRTSDQSRSSPMNNSYKPLSVKTSSSRLSLHSRSSSRASSICSADVREDTRLSTGSVNSDVIDTPSQTTNREDEDVEMQVIETNEERQTFDDMWSDNWNSTTTGRRSNDLLLPSSHVRQSSLMSYGVTRQHVSQTPILSQLSQTSSHAPVPTVLHIVNVKVEDQLLAVPVQNPSLSIGWLAEEAAKRYYRVSGCLPVLSIYSLEGALFSNDDPVSVVLGGDIIGRVQSWNVSSTLDRYKEACQLLSTDMDNNILSILEAREETRVIEIVDSLFQAPLMKPVFKAISMEHNLSKINLSNNVLHDEGIMDLSENLSKLFSLKELNLSGNGITAQGVSYLAAAAKKGHLKALLDLNLSHNNLSDGSLTSITDLTASVQGLESLSLADCMFTKSIWDKSEHFLTLNNLRSLDLSSNQLHTKGLAGFLGFSDPNKDRRLSPEKLHTLRLIGLGGERLCQEVLLFLEQANSIALRELHLSYSAMQDEDVTQLLDVLRSAPEFHTLRLPGAQNISAKTVCHLLLRNPPLKQLEIHNSKMMWKNANEEDVIHAINHVANTDMEKLTLRDAPTATHEVWTGVKGPSSVIRRGAFGLQMFFAQSNSQN